MNLLVTGGAGFIGSNFIKHMLDKYSELTIINVDKLTYAANPYYLINYQQHSRYHFIEADISQRSQMLQILKDYNISHVINFAAESHVDRSISNSLPFIQSNVQGVVNLLECIKQHPVEKFIQMSTDEVYGDILSGEFVESSPLKASSPYSASKASADLFIQSYERTYNLPTIIVRSSNNFGENQHQEKLIPVVIKALLTNTTIPVYGNGQQTRDWIYVGETVQALDAVLQQGQLHEIYHIGANQTMTNLELIHHLAQLIGVEAQLKFVADRPGHDVRYALNVDKIKQQLGWQAKGQLTEQLQKTIAWYKEMNE